MSRPPALVLSGGIALGAFHAGAYAAMDAAEWRPDWMVGTSIGAITAALIAGGPPDQAVERLRAFWAGVATEPGVFVPAIPSGLEALGSWSAALRAQLFGRQGVFRPRAPAIGPDRHPSLYDISPLRDRLAGLIDFGLVNDGPVRLTVTATGAVDGRRVVFDTHRGARLTMEHLLAASAFMPLFPPVEIDGRLLVDGGLTTNLPADLVLDTPDGHDTCVLVDLFAAEGTRPDRVLSALSRAMDLTFASQSRLVLQRCAREQALRQTIERLGKRLPDACREDPAVMADLAEGRGKAVEVISVGYRAIPGDAGPEKGFDFSGRSLAARWEAGAAAMVQAMPVGARRD